MTAVDEKRYCDALRLFVAMHTRWPSARAIYNAAEVAYAAGDRARALDLYRDAQQQYPAFEKKDVVQKRVDEVFKAMVAGGPGTACPIPANTCGDWFVATPEQCDDGNTKDGDGCDGNCTVTTCGNGVVTSGEECDDQNGVDGDKCDHNCTATRCGNGIVSAGEQCDDGNTASGDGCDHDCTTTRCGNGTRTAGEQCDDGNERDGDGCDVGCLVTKCGNGVVTTGEQCDDGNTKDADGCEHTCTITRVAAPLTGEVTAVVGGAVAVGGGALFIAGAVAADRHNRAVSAVNKLEEDFQNGNQEQALRQVGAAREEEQRAFDDWTSFGIPSIGGGALLGLGGLAALGAGIYLALTQTVEAPAGTVLVTDAPK